MSGAHWALEWSVHFKTRGSERGEGGSSAGGGGGVGGWKSGWNLPAASLGNTEANSPNIAPCWLVTLDGGPQELPAGEQGAGHNPGVQRSQGCLPPGSGGTLGL